MEPVTPPRGWLEPDDREPKYRPKKIIAPGIRAALNKLNREKDSHRPECPMGQCGSISTLCLCSELDKADQDAKRDFLREETLDNFNDA